MYEISDTLVIVLILVFNAVGGLSENCSVEYSTKFQGLFANCSGRNLQRVPGLNISIVALDLSGNNIKLQNKDFNYPSLVYLNLSYNGLNRLPGDVFTGCENLSVLDLGNNKLRYNNVSFPRDVFKSQRNLRSLNLGFNDDPDTGVYPDEMFRNLAGLENLTIDSSRIPQFGQGFKALVSLRLLNLSGKSAHCRIEKLHNDSLSVFSSSNIVSLDLSYCGDLSEIQTNAFAPLKKHLKNLSLEKAKSLGLHRSLSALYGLQGTNMTSLNFRYVDLRKVLITRRIQDEQLLAENLQYLENICVSELNLAHNHILYIDFASFFNHTKRFCRCLSHLDLHGNEIYGDYKLDTLSVLLVASSLTYLDLSSFTCYQKRGNTKPRFMFSQTSSFIDDTVWSLPLKLETLIINAAKADLIMTKPVYFNKNNSFKALSVCNYDKVVFTGSIEGLVNLKTLKIAHNNDMTLGVSSFDTFPSLENLYLNDVSLPEGYFCQNGRRLFSKLTNLIILDLSGNDIRCLPNNIFKDNHKLQTLILSNNQFHTIPFDINHVPSLLTLKMDGNQIDVLGESTTNSLDIHASNTYFHLNLSGNKLTCVCGESLYFLSWLQDNDYLINREQYSCTIYNGSSVRVMDVNAERLWRHCSGQVWLLIAIPLFVFDILVFVSSFLVLKHKTQAIYFFKNLFHKCAMCPTRTDYKFDICLCYADQNWREACLDIAVHLERRYGYKVYFHNRNSIPGEPLADSIMYGINNSWKTVLLLTQNFIEDGWSWFTMHVAIRAVTWRTPYRLIVLRDPRRACEIPDCILCVVDEDRILPMPDKDVDESWEALVRLI